MAKHEGWEGTGLEVLRTPDFQGRHLKREGVYAVCFAATWCPPTQRFVPKFLARSRERLPARFAMADITDLEDPLWDTFAIEITPTMAVFEEGVLKARFDGRRVIGLKERDLDALARFLTDLSAHRAAPSGAQASVTTGPPDPLHP